ncbi:hypothetical protein [Mesorhizobium sp. B263B2A]|uniref:hypothetical protein n=1 Tax=Mesorhizobium sp. B263B2A TaxID=2876669 RepID=UPI001CD06F48|nr:hypothetical protein [Mesorhizobium sp. B263B2A]MCA0031300.1 hypothetical protein [Mesorhizobium sp. B263B2A]
MATFLSDYFSLDESVFEDYGAVNISVVNDLPLFVDPFLLFHSEKPEYVALHEQIIEYLVFLRDRAAEGRVSDGQLRNWYCFPEVKQNWLGFSETGNDGAGLGIDFARNLHANLHVIFSDFGAEKITESSHLEKVCLVSNGVGRDNISDFTTNLIKDFLCRYTEKFTEEHLPADAVRDVWVDRAKFNYKTQSWSRGRYKLPWVNGDYVILTPRDVLTRDENWINRDDLVTGFEEIPEAIPDAQLRAAVFNYFELELRRRTKVEEAPDSRRGRRRPRREKKPSQKERSAAVVATMQRFPQIIDYYIRLKEMRGDEAKDVSEEKVLAIEYLFIEQLQKLQSVLMAETDFYKIGKTTYDEAHARLAYLKDVIENKGGHRFFYDDKGEPFEREKDLHVLYRLVWFGTPSDAGAEANDGRGPVDFKISRGRDKTLVEMKLAKNTKLEQNLAKQAEIYQAASDAKKAIKAIIYFTAAELMRVKGILKKLGLEGNRDVVLIDARRDNKPSASKAA